ncbi:hypothetical protein J6590_085402 [Homalodisca vitripennis]|nr:hypothetical protein J6590_085402 [Homalodisca vitripennis]
MRDDDLTFILTPDNPITHCSDINSELFTPQEISRLGSFILLGVTSLPLWWLHDFRTTTNGRTGELLAKTGDCSAVTHPSSSHAQRYLMWLTCDNRCIHYATPLTRDK